MIPLLDAPWMPIFLLAIFALHPLLGLVGVFGAVALLALVLGAEIATRRPVLRAIGLAIETTDTAEGTVRNADVIEAMGMLPAVIRRWHQAQQETLGLQGKVARRNVTIGALAKFLRLGLQLGVFGIGAYLAIHNELTAGAMIAASILMGRALAPLEMAIGGWRSAVGAFGAYRRVRSQLEASPIARSSMSLPTPHGALTVEAASYTYPGQQRPLLKSVSFALGSGQALGILGPAGAGKTTLARLLAGTLRPQVGHVRLDGVEVASLSPRDRLTAIGYIPQNVQLFRGSVRDNITRFEDATDQQVVEAAQLVGAHEMILHLPQGYETQVGDAGQALSGGQRQWVALARAVYAVPKLLVLDEPGSSLDPQGEAALTDAVKRLKAMGITIVIIAHRGPVLRQLDSLLLLRNGQVERTGPLRQLLPTLVAPATGAGWPQFGQTGRHG